MKQLPILILIVLAGLLCGCRTTGHIDPGVLSRVNLGMTKQEVIAAIGSPQSVTAQRGSETMFYVEERPWWQWEKLQVQFVNGKVTSYGQVPADSEGSKKDSAKK